MGAIEGYLLEANEVIGDGSIAVYSPLDSLFGEYLQKRGRIEKLHGCIQEHMDAVGYFVDGAAIEGGVTGNSVSTVFSIGPAIRSLDAQYWARAMALTDCLEVMPAKRRLEWNMLIARRVVERKDERGSRVMDERNRPVMDELPPFDKEIVWATISDLLASRQKFLGERVSGLFNRLSGTHVTNSPSGFNQRMIVDRIFDSMQLMNYGIVEYVHDLRCVIAKFMGRDAPYSRATDYSLSALVKSGKFGQWASFDAGALRMKVFKKGTLHVEVNPEIAYRLNQVLAWMHPLAIPSEFRTKPTKQNKEFNLSSNALSFSVLGELEGLRGSHGTRTDAAGTTLWSSGGGLSEEAARVLGFLGGVQQTKSSWAFEYKVKDVLEEVIRTGLIPEQKSHQFWATEEKLAAEAVSLADIDGCTSLLEPSAGQGGLAKFLPAEHTVCVEISNLQCKILEAKGFNVHCADFLGWNVNRKFERIVMNPPFANGRAKAHVEHAATMLEKGGRLVAILPASFKNSVIAEGMTHTWSQVYKDEFKGTGVSVVILVLE
jgi:predicted RNA methylase